MTTEIPVKLTGNLKQGGEGSRQSPGDEEEELSLHLPWGGPRTGGPSSPLPPGCWGFGGSPLWVFTEFYLNHNHDHIWYGSFLLLGQVLRTSGFTTRKTETWQG